MYQYSVVPRFDVRPGHDLGVYGLIFGCCSYNYIFCAFFCGISYVSLLELLTFTNAWLIVTMGVPTRGIQAWNCKKYVLSHQNLDQWADGHRSWRWLIQEMWIPFFGTLLAVQSRQVDINWSPCLLHKLFQKRNKNPFGLADFHEPYTLDLENNWSLKNIYHLLFYYFFSSTFFDLHLIFLCAYCSFHCL